MKAIDLNINENQEALSIAMTERTDNLLYMILGLKQERETDLQLMQTLVLSMYKDSIDLLHIVGELSNELEARKRKTLEIPRFMMKGKEAQ